MDFFITRHPRSFRVTSIAGISLIWILLSAAAAACPIELPTAVIAVKGHALTVELATTPKARSCGLSHRAELPQNRGMLFIFADRQPRYFWMKDTFIPLSIAYLDAAGKIFSIQDMVPLQTDEQYPSSQPAAYALEVNQGWFRSHGIEVGDVVEMKLPLVLNIR